MKYYIYTARDERDDHSRERDLEFLSIRDAYNMQRSHSRIRALEFRPSSDAAVLTFSVARALRAVLEWPIKSSACVYIYEMKKKFGSSRRASKFSGRP